MNENIEDIKELKKEIERLKETKSNWEFHKDQLMESVEYAQSEIDECDNIIWKLKQEIKELKKEK